MLKSVFTAEGRNFGLDVVRCLAITCVLTAHSGVYTFFGLNLGFVGVEIFFVLSGFLIGQILVRDFAAPADSRIIFKFYLHRWLRTLPLYLLVLIVKDLCEDGGTHLRFYFFSQRNSDLTFFPVSWSLQIEEWFYLLLPLFL